MASVSDIPDVVQGTAPEPRKLSNYQSFISGQRGLLAYNAYAYVNKRTARKNKFSDSTLKKVLNIATFIPAHPTRYTPGEFNVEKIKYFVLHRPGRTPQASTLLNTIREFAQENRPASTHFLVGFNGEIIQMVDLQDVSFHVGGSTMPDGKKNGNYTSVGVEVEGAVGQHFTYEQYVAIAKIVGIMNDISGFLPNKNLADFIIQSKSVLVGHSEILPNEKIDPGPNFNYMLLGYLLRNMAPTTRAEWYRAPVDALASLDTALQEIYFQAANPGSKAEASLLNMASGNALANARQLYMQFGGREQLAQWAANTAEGSSLSMAQSLAAYTQQMARLSASVPEMPASSSAALLNYDSGLYSDEVS